MFTATISIALLSSAVVGISCFLWGYFVGRYEAARKIGADISDLHFHQFTAASAPAAPRQSPVVRISTRIDGATIHQREFA